MGNVCVTFGWCWFFNNSGVSLPPNEVHLKCMTLLYRPTVYIHYIIYIHIMLYINVMLREVGGA